MVREGKIILVNKTEIEQAEHAQMLSDCKNILESNGAPAILTGSALLGAYRDGDLVPWCYGAVLSSYRNKLLENQDKIISDLENSGFKIARHRTGNNYKIKADKWKFNIEIVGYSLDNEYFFRQLHNKKKVIPKRFLLPPFGEIELRGVTYQTPKDIEGFLEFIYQDWKTPTRSGSPSTYKNKEHMRIEK